MARGQGKAGVRRKMVLGCRGAEEGEAAVELSLIISLCFPNSTSIHSLPQHVKQDSRMIHCNTRISWCNIVSDLVAWLITLAAMRSTWGF